MTSYDEFNVVMVEYQKNFVNMKLNKLSIIIGLIALVGFSACEKQDVYQDWKRMNDEWFDANKDKTDSYPFDWTVEVLKTPIVSQNFVTSTTGVKYKALRFGNPTDKKPNPTSEIWVTYEGKLIDGTTFDKGVDAYLGAISSSVSGFKEVLSKMHIGDIYEIYIPWEQGYGETGNYSIPPYSVLTFRVELVDVIK